MASRDVVTLNETAGRVEVPQVGDTYRLPADTDVQGNQTVSGNQTVAGTATHQGQVVVGGVSRNTWPTPGSAAVAIDDVLKNGHVSTRRMTLGGYDVSAIHQTLPIASFVDHDFFDNTDDAAWIDRQGHTSWENEVRHVGAQFMAATYANDAAAIAANPSIVSGNLYYNGMNFIEYGTATVRTRGSSRKFPMRGVVTAEAGRVIVWSTTGGKPEMWMVFTSGWIGDGGSTVTSVAMLGGVLVIGASILVGITEIYFPSDLAYERRTSGQYHKNDVASRGALSNVNKVFPTIVNNTVNDVAITFLPDAPLDEYGMRIPTIAVATDGGVSVIKDDGSVVNPHTTGAYGVISVDWFGDALIASRDGGGPNFVGHFYNRPAWSVGVISYYLTSPNLTWLSPRFNIRSNTMLGRGMYALGGMFVQVVSTGIVLIRDNPTTPANGMVAYITNTSSTGWMVGDMQIAAFCDSTVGAITTSSPNRSVKTTAITVAGTLTQTAISTGSIASVSGFFNGVNTAVVAAGLFDANAKSFSMSLWYKRGATTNAGGEMPLATGDFGTLGAARGVYISPAGVFTFLGWGTSYDLASSFSTAVGVWAKLDVSVTYVSGTTYDIVLYANGVNVGSGTKTNLATFTSTAWDVGGGSVGVDPGGYPSFGYISMARVSATVPTAEQIAYMYKTEAPLFQTGAQALLSNSSNVTDLRYDKKTDQYTVKNGTNTDLFSGLERVASKLTTATDYTASNGAAIEAPAVTSLSGNVLNVPAVDVASELAAMHKQDKHSLIKALAAAGGVVSLPMGYKPIGCYDVTGAALVRLTTANTAYDGFIYSITGLTGTQTYDVTMETV